MKIPVSLLLTPFVLSTLVVAQNQTASWPNFGGPRLDNISTETQWKVKGNKKLWEAQVGLGYSNVAVAGGKLFTMGHNKDAEMDTVYCLDALTGKQLWTYMFPGKTMAQAHMGGSLSTPSVDGKLLFVSQREGQFFCMDAEKGKVKWKKNLREEFDASKPIWGLSAAPLVMKDKIVMNVGPVLAFDRAGELVWKTKSFGHAYSTPAPFTHGGNAYLAVFSGDGLTIISPDSGDVIATSAWKTRYDVNAATPLVIGNKLFISSGYGKGCSMLEFDGKKLKTLWSNRNMRNHMTGCVYYKNHLYGFDESMLKCLDMEGEETWRQRGLGKSALTLADGKLIILGGRGDLIVAKASPKKYTELSRAKKVVEGGRLWTSPVLCGGLIYCRNNLGHLVCVDRRTAKASAKKAAPKATSKPIK